MTGLRLLNEIMDPADPRSGALRAHTSYGGGRGGADSRSQQLPRKRAAQLQSADRSSPIPAAPYLDRKVRVVPQLAEVWSYINPFMLYGRHLGSRAISRKLWPIATPRRSSFSTT